MKALFVYLCLVSSVATGVPVDRVPPTRADCAQTPLKAVNMKDCKNIPGYTRPRVYDLPAGIATVTGMAATSTGDLALVGFMTNKVFIVSTQGQEKRNFTVAEASLMYDIAREQGVFFVVEYLAKKVHVSRENGSEITKMAMSPRVLNECVVAAGIYVIGNTMWLSCKAGLFELTFDANYSVTKTILLVPADKGRGQRPSVLGSRIIMPDFIGNSLKFFYRNGSVALPPVTNITQPFAVVTDSCDRHYVSETGQLRVILVSETGEFIKEVLNKTSIGGTADTIILLDGSVIGISKALGDKLFVVDII